GRDKLLQELDVLAVTIQAVRQKDAVIDMVRSADFWQNATIEKLEHARQELRGIMKYRTTQSGGLYTTPTTSTVDGGVQEAERKVIIAGANEAMIYRRRLK